MKVIGKILFLTILLSASLLIMQNEADAGFVQSADVRVVLNRSVNISTDRYILSATATTRTGSIRSLRARVHAIGILNTDWNNGIGGATIPLRIGASTTTPTIIVGRYQTMAAISGQHIPMGEATWDNRHIISAGTW